MRVRLAALVLLTVAGCPAVELTRAGRPCGPEQACAEGLECHPETGRCVGALARGCAAAGEVCAWRVVTGDACAPAGAFLPCVPERSDCLAGCRSCLPDGTWSDCSAATCVLGQPWSCHSCDDDCRSSVRHAEPACVAVGALWQCDYTGACWGAAVDADGQRANGCECLPAGDEQCNGRDDDCNGTTDEGFPLGDACGTGACAGGQLECDLQATSGTRCSTMPGGSAARDSVEVCSGFDEDCDGAVDNGFACALGQVESCDVGVGPSSGERRCGAPACAFGSCLPVWWSDAYPLRLIIDLRTVLLAAAVDDLPLLVRLTPERFDYGRARADGADLQFVAMDGETLLAHELDTWQPGGESSVWVSVPQVLPDEPAFIVLYYGAGVDSGAARPVDVWGRYRAAWHLGEEAAGRGTLGLYRDATGTGRAADDLVAVQAKSGLIGAGQGFVELGDSVRVGNPSALVGADAFTLEAWARAEAEGWRTVIPVSLNPATDRDGMQILVPLSPDTFDYGLSVANGLDLCFLDDDGRVAPHWRGEWIAGGDSQVWVRVPRAGTTRLRMLVGNAGVTTVDDPAAVFDFWWSFADGLPDAVWTVASSEVAVAGGELRLGKGGVALAQPLAFDLRDRYIITVAARFDETTTAYSGTLPLVADARFIAGGNASANVAVMAMRQSTGIYGWIGSGNQASYDQLNAHYLGSASLGGWIGFTLVLSTGRVDYYAGGTLLASRSNVTLARPVHFLSLGSFYGGATHDIQNTSYAWIVVRKEGAWPTVTLGAPTAAGLSVAGRFGLGLGAGGVRASVGTTHLSAPVGSGWHHLALVYGGGLAALFVDGAQVQEQAAALTLTGLWPLHLGEGAALLGWVDEVRVAPAALDGATLRAHADAVSGVLVSYRLSQERP